MKSCLCTGSPHATLQRALRHVPYVRNSCTGRALAVPVHVHYRTRTAGCRPRLCCLHAVRCEFVCACLACLPACLSAFLFGAAAAARDRSFVLRIVNCGPVSCVPDDLHRRLGRPIPGPAHSACAAPLLPVRASALRPCQSCHGPAQPRLGVSRTTRPAAVAAAAAAAACSKWASSFDVVLGMTLGCFMQRA